MISMSAGAAEGSRGRGRSQGTVRRSILSGGFWHSHYDRPTKQTFPPPEKDSGLPEEFPKDSLPPKWDVRKGHSGVYQLPSACVLCL